MQYKYVVHIKCFLTNLYLCCQESGAKKKWKKIRKKNFETFFQIVTMKFFVSTYILSNSDYTLWLKPKWSWSIIFILLPFHDIFFRKKCLENMSWNGKSVKINNFYATPREFWPHCALLSKSWNYDLLTLFW